MAEASPSASRPRLCKQCSASIVGGQYVPGANDTGLTRIWYDDTPYLFGVAIGVTSQAPENVTIKYSKDVPRFHFCEYLRDKINQSVFDIFVNNQTAQEAADVIAWSGAQGGPVYKDYATYVSDGGGDDESLWVALHPSVWMKPEYYDSIVNGLEVFKVNDTAGYLAGPNPVPSTMLVKAEVEKGFASPAPFERVPVVGGVVGAFAGFTLVVSVFFLVRRNRGKGSRGSRMDSRVASWLRVYGSSHATSTTATSLGKSNTSTHISSLAGGLCRHFSLTEIKHATRNFNESQVIGVGGFGKVFKGAIDGGSTKVAIKRSNPSSEQGINEFQTEIEMLSKLRHKHLVSLIGFCEENGEMILVYDYMGNGTLREHLYKSSNPPLPWKQRLEICIRAARGLHYLHTGAKYTIIHRDVKTTNILLDEKWVAKVSDFGLSKTRPNLNQTHVSTVVKGSFGYLHPEYFRRQQLTEKSDVYSFGVVLFEVLCGRAALNPSLPKEQVSLADWARSCHRKGTLEEIMDPNTKGQVSPECFRKFTETAEKCLSDQGFDRPSMGDVLWNLEFALQLEEKPDRGGPQTGINRASVDYRMHVTTIDLDDDSSAGSAMNEADSHEIPPLFSQLVNPTGR
ncbi:hypothetical protein SAY87_030992 [Trapa incisa]|uniref:Protein kinase domain-containing protein n=1 Tax=Trapa incisa TaxID=236973 RepID=A0AAN7KPC3_9MYRT|nr:hypothetical protein SAY87_030992 [Trapa incisa]